MDIRSLLYVISQGLVKFGCSNKVIRKLERSGRNLHKFCQIAIGGNNYSGLISPVVSFSKNSLGFEINLNELEFLMFSTKL